MNFLVKNVDSRCCRDGSAVTITHYSYKGPYSSSVPSTHTGGFAVTDSSSYEESGVLLWPAQASAAMYMYLQTHTDRHTNTHTPLI